MSAAAQMRGIRRTVAEQRVEEGELRAEPEHRADGRRLHVLYVPGRGVLEHDLGFAHEHAAARPLPARRGDGRVPVGPRLGAGGGHLPLDLLQLGAREEPPETPRQCQSWSKVGSGGVGAQREGPHLSTTKPSSSHCCASDQLSAAPGDAITQCQRVLR